MDLEKLQPGDIIYAAQDILNDGSIPFVGENELVASKGTRGVLVNTGFLEENEDQSVYLVRFEDDEKKLNDPIGCWPEDLIAELPN